MASLSKLGQKDRSASGALGYANGAMDDDSGGGQIGGLQQQGQVRPVHCSVALLGLGAGASFGLVPKITKLVACRVTCEALSSFMVGRVQVRYACTYNALQGLDHQAVIEAMHWQLSPSGA